MDISDDQLVPVGGGDLRPVPGQAPREPVGTFTVTGITDPSEVWAPRSHEVAPPDRPIMSRMTYKDAESERPVQRQHVGSEWPFNAAEVAQSARAAVRPGVLA